MGDETGIDGQIPHTPRGMVIFPADEGASGRGGEWWLVAAAVLVAGLLIALALLVR